MEQILESSGDDDGPGGSGYIGHVWPIFFDLYNEGHLETIWNLPTIPVSDPEHFNTTFNTTEIVKNASDISKITEMYPYPYEQLYNNLTRILFNWAIAIICVLGLVGNGRTIYLLAYSIKRNSFTTLILNLSIADFGALTSLLMTEIFVAALTLVQRTYTVKTFFFLFFELFFFTYSASQFLLTALSLDRCVVVLFPLWHRCHRPPYLLALVSGLIWVVTFLLCAVHYILYQTRAFESSRFLYQLIVNGLLCIPIMVVSTVTLWIHMRSKTQHNQRKLLTAILLALLCFLLFSLPIDAFYAIEYFSSYNPLLMTIGMGCASLNSSINPLLYFLVGRKKSGKNQPRASLKVALQRVFRDEQDSSEEQQTTEETIL